MAQFIYTAMDANGREQKGKISANDENAAAAELKRQGLFPTSIVASDGSSAKGGKKAAKKKKKSSGGFNLNVTIGTPVIKRKELTIITRQLATLLDAGLPLIRSLNTLARQAKNPIVKNILTQTSESVEGGSTFAEALAQNPKSFDKLYLNMIRAGEASGAMESILNRLALFMEKAARISGKVKSAMIYPSVVMTIALGVTAALMIFIVPNFQKIFKELLGEKEELPALTRGVMKFSELLKDQIFVVAAVVIGIIVLVKLINKTNAGRFMFDWIKYNMPLFGPIVSRSAIARFSRTLGTLMASGVPVLNALVIVRDTSGNEVVAKAVQKVHDSVKEGEGIAAPLGATAIFPAMVISMVEVGEETGKLPEMLDKIANTYEEEVDNAVSALTSMIEPLLIVFLAVVVGTVVIALFLPLTTLIDKMGAQN